MKKVLYKIEDKKIILYLLTICFLVYTSTYLGRLNYSAAITEIIKSEGLSKSQTGFIGTIFFLTYGIGQFISGFLGDKFSPKKLVFWGTFISAISNSFIAFIPNYIFMCLFWGINGIFQALIWSPMLRAIVEYLNDEIKTKACVYLNFSVPIGSMFAYGLTGTVIKFYNWKTIFIIAGILLLIMSFIWLFILSFIEKYAIKNGNKIVISDNKEIKNNNNNYSLKNIIIYSGLIYILIGLFIQGILKDGVTTWIPTYIDETYNVGSFISIISTMFIPILNLLGVSISFIINNKIFKDEIKTSTFFFILSTISLFILYIISGKNMSFSLIMFGISTTCMMSVNTMLIASLPSYFSSVSKVSSVSGLLNSIVYLGSAFSTYSIGSISNQFGWEITIFILTVLSLIATIVCLCVTKKWINYKIKNLY